MTARVKVDEKGRITLPRDVRDALNITPGDELLVNVRGNRIIIEKSVNPFEKLAKLLDNISFDRKLRAEAEQELIRGVIGRWERGAKEVPSRNGVSASPQS